jgi:hypothetical protein
MIVQGQTRLDMKPISNLPARQQGVGYYALVVVLTLLGIFIFTGLKIMPAYVSDGIVTTSLNNLKESGELSSMSLRDIRQHVVRTMQANGESFNSDSIDQVEENRVDFIVVEYETRLPLFYNMDVVVKFNHRIEK